MWLTNRREQQVQITRDVRHCSDGRTWIAANRFLFDRDDGRQTEHEIDIRLCDLGDKSLRVARKRLHVTALPFGVDRVECQARFARSRESGNNNEAVPRNFERDALEIVNARALY